MTTLFTLSEQEINSHEWEKAREMCALYGYDIHEIAAGIARFRMIRAEFRSKALAEYAANNPSLPPPAPATLVHFKQVKQFWDAHHQRWTKPGIVYMGRAVINPYINLPASPFGNPFRIEKDTDESRTDAIELYANWIMLPEQAHLLRQLDELRGKILVCWCFPRRCHCDVLLKLMLDKPSYSETQTEVTQEGSPQWQPALNMTAF